MAMTSQKNLKVCLVAISLGGGGLERSCAMLSQMLARQGHSVHLVILNDAVDYPFSGKLLNLGKLKSANDSLWKRLLRFRVFRKYLQDENFDVVIDHRPKNNFRREQFYANYLYRGFSTIYVVHGSVKEQYLTDKPEAFAKICKKNLVNVAVSRYIEMEILKKNGIDNSTTIHNAFNVEWTAQLGNLPEKLQGKNYHLFYGRLDDDIKDISFLIEAFSLSGIWKKKYHLVILGDGKDLQKLQNLAAAKEGGGQIVFLSFMEKPFSVIANARSVCLTSKHEGFPMVLVESLALGTPVVAVRIPSGPSEIIEHGKNGLLVSQRNLPLFAEALQKMTFDEKFYSEVKRQTKSSVERFSMQRISEIWNKTLQNVLS